jgi:hypothetical protein
MKPIYTILLTALGGIVLGAVGFMAVDYFTKDQNQRTPVTSLPGATTTVMVDSVATPPPPTYKSPDLQMELARGDVRKIVTYQKDGSSVEKLDTKNYDPEGWLNIANNPDYEDCKIKRNSQKQITSMKWENNEFVDVTEFGSDYKYNKDGFLKTNTFSGYEWGYVGKFTYNNNDDLIKYYKEEYDSELKLNEKGDIVQISSYPKDLYYSALGHFQTLYEKTPTEQIKEKLDNNEFVVSKMHYYNTNKEWCADGYTYKYRLIFTII